MLTLELTINVFVFGFLLVIAALAGFSLRRSQIVRSRFKIEELEREILNNYAHILELEKENTGMEAKLKDIQIPVITLKTTVKEEPQEFPKVPDISLRKKLLSRENLQKQIGNL